MTSQGFRKASRATGLRRAEADEVGRVADFGPAVDGGTNVVERRLVDNIEVRGK